MQQSQALNKYSLLPSILFKENKNSAFDFQMFLFALSRNESSQSS